ncbi:MAG: hypothetical protein JW808_00225 [Victivallales bacterium]|nr:hypothetical protein [Victivallales bacterium]
MRKLEIVSCVVALLFLSGLRLHTLDPGQENSHDTYYHVVMADLGPGFFMSRKLPYMTMSYWFENFSDKELGFHLLLWALRGSMRAVNLETGAPFHIEHMFLALLLLVCFSLTARYFGMPRIQLLILGLVGFSPFLLTRLVAPRPHLLGISLMLIACIAFDKMNSLRQWYLAFACGFVMAWAYSNPHFVLLPAVAFGLHKENWRLAVCIPVLTLAGIAAGFTLHPQFPNTFVNWKIQCVDVMLVSFSRDNPVVLGTELRPANWSFILAEFMLIAVFIVNITLFVRRWMTQGSSALFCRQSPFLLISTVATLGVFLAIRGVEYALPFNMLALGMALSDSSDTKLQRYVGRPGFSIAFALLLLVAMVVNGRGYIRKATGLGITPYDDFAEWAETAGMPEGTYVANANWSDFPLLLYAAPQFIYSLGIDPMFAYHKYPDRVTRLEMFRTGKHLISQEELYEIVKSRFIFVSRYNRALSTDMYKLGYRSVYQGRDGDLFILPKPQRDTTSHDPHESNWLN